MTNLTISFSANNTDLVNTTGREVIPSDTIGYIEADFVLGTNWSGWDVIKAVWNAGKVTVAVPLENGSCIVPHEVLAVKDSIKVNLVGYTADANDELTARLTTFQVIAISVAQKVKVEGNDTTPTVMARIDQLVNEATEARDEAVEAADGVEEYAIAAAASASSAASSASSAATSASNAATSESNASDSETAASASASAAASSAQTASTKATEASESATSAATSAQTATNKASEASASATAASGSATAAASSAEDASDSADSASASATAAATSAQTATNKASEAATSASNAATSESNAADSETNAASSASTASTKASEAASSASTASTKASEASQSATSAAGSASTATAKASEASQSAIETASSASDASDSATAAASSESNAAASMTAAGQSATAAAGSASTASAKASEAAQSANDAATSASNAATSESNAAGSASSASASAQTATTKASEASTSASNAASSASDASASASDAADSAEDSEAWAVGKRNGVDVPSTDPQYNNSAKYWAEQAESSAFGQVDTAMSDSSTNPVRNNVIKQYVDSGLSDKSDTSHTHDDRYYTESEVNTLLSGKVDTVSGKGLSANDFTNTLKNKLDNIESGAEVNVQADWSETDSTSDSYIANKPQNLVSDASYVHTDNNYTSAEKNKLEGIASGAEVNVQSDWSESDSSADDYIKNKPTNVSDFTNDAGYLTSFTETDPTVPAWAKAAQKPSYTASEVGAATAASVSVTLTVAGWSNSSQSVTATGVTASNDVIVSPAPASAEAYSDAGILCTEQAANNLTFTCSETPSEAITVNVLIITE